MSEELSMVKQYAAQLAEWDKRIVGIVGMQTSGKGEGMQEEKLDLICAFAPEPPGGIIGFFWIANLLTRIEAESLDERLDVQQPFELGFRIGEQVFLPDGQILKVEANPIVLWPNYEE